MISHSYLKKKYKFEPKDICYIGANEGQELPEMIKQFPDSKIYCFEPQEKPFRILKNKFREYENILFYNFALGEVNKNVEMYVNNNNQNMSSSILEPKEHTVHHPDVTFSGLEEIDQKRFSDLGILDANYLNLDTQGYELQILKGFDNLDDINFIKTEINRKEIYKSNTLVKDLDNYLKTYGFIRVETIWFRKTIPWGEAFYIKKSKISFLEFLTKKVKYRIQGIKGYFWILSRLVDLNLIRRDKNIL